MPSDSKGQRLDELEQPILEQSVVELRRFAAHYLDRQGALAQQLVERYGGFGIDAAQVRLLETLTHDVPEKSGRGGVNGHMAVFEQAHTKDVADFEREAKMFFRLTEKELRPTAYDRVGVLFGYILDVADVNLWLRNTLGFSKLPAWIFSEYSLRFISPAIDWQPLVTIQVDSGSLSGQGKSPAGKISVMVDQFQLNPEPSLGTNLDIQGLHREAERIVKDLLDQEV